MAENPNQACGISIDVTRLVDGHDDKKTVCDYHPQIYMNCGAWGDGKSDFALVSGGVLVLGSWCNAHRASSNPLDTMKGNREERLLNKVGGNQKIFDFFLQAHKQDRGNFRDVWISPVEGFKFSEEDELLIFVGDCHINLIKEWGPDNFVRRSSERELADGITRVSMSDEFTRFIDFASSQTSKDKLIQIGDLYEYWEAQNLFEQAANVLADLMEACSTEVMVGDKGLALKEFPPEILSQPDKYIAAANQEFDWYCPNQHHDDLISENDKTPIYLARYFGIESPAFSVNEFERNEAWKQWFDAVRKKFYDSKPTIRDVLALIFYGDSSNHLSIVGTGIHTLSNNTPPIRFDQTVTSFRNRVIGWNQQAIDHFKQMCDRLKMVDDPCDFLSCDDLKTRIEAQHDPEIWDKFTPIAGNHDIHEQDAGGAYKNLYLEKVFREGKSLAAARSELATLAGTKFDLQQDRLDPDCKLEDPYLTGRCGIKDQIVFEHGHVWDVYNNPKNYFLFQVNQSNPLNSRPFGEPDENGETGGIKWLDGGYHACRGWTVGDPLSPYDGDMNDASSDGYTESGKRLVLPEADTELAYACEIRMSAIFEKNAGDVSLVVMGHTHAPYIMSHSDWLKNPARSEMENSKLGLRDALLGR